MEALGLWLSAFFTLAIFSFLYKDNPFYKFAEHIYVGVSTGYLVVVTLSDALKRDVYDSLFRAKPEYIVIIPALLGCIMFLRFYKKTAWISRISIALIVGIGAGVSIPSNVQTYLLEHSRATMVPLVTSNGWRTDVDNFLILLGVLTVLFYFFFSVRHDRALKPVSRTGIIYLMLFFGAQFGYTVMGRVSLLIGRVRFLLEDWLHVTKWF